MKAVQKITISILILFVFTSCATHGREFNQDKIQETIKIGTSTKDDVLKLCGEPLMINRDAINEIEIWHYAYTQKNMSPFGVISHTLVGAEKWKSNTSVMDIYFKNDKVTDMKYESSKIERVNTW